MNTKRIILSLLAAVMLAAGTTVFGQNLMDVRTPSTRASAMGGRHAALTDDLDTLFSNPAGFQSVDSELSVAELTIGLSGPIFDIFGVVIDAGSGGGAESLLASPSVQDLLSGLYSSVDVLGPVSFGYVGRGLGFGIFNTSTITIANEKPLTVTAYMSERLTLTGGYSFSVPFPEESLHSLSFGLLLKGVMEGQVEIEKSFLEFPTLFSSFSAATITGEPFHFISAIGFDLGMLYSFDDRFHFGLTGIDAFTPAMISTYSTMDAFIGGTETPATSNSIYPARVNFGFMYTPRLGSLGRILSSLKFMLDYDDIFDFLIQPATARNPLLHIGFGTEVEILEILAVRFGMYEGLFSAGIGLDLKVLTLNAAMFGTELSSEPGLRPVYNILIGLEFRFDQK